jgi:hypothetical protein
MEENVCVPLDHCQNLADGSKTEQNQPQFICTLSIFIVKQVSINPENIKGEQSSLGGE